MSNIKYCDPDKLAFYIIAPDDIDSIKTTLPQGEIRKAIMEINHCRHRIEELESDNQYLNNWKSEAEVQLVEYGKLAVAYTELQAVVDRLADKKLFSADNILALQYDTELYARIEYAKQHATEKEE